MDLVSLRVVHNCATLKTSSTILFPLLNVPFGRPGMPSLTLPRPPPVCGNAALVTHAKKRNSYAQAVTKPKKDTQIEEEFEYDEAVGEEDEEEFEYDEVGEDEIEEEEEEEDEKENDNYLDEGIIWDDHDDEDDFDFEDLEDEIEAGTSNIVVGDGGDGGGISLGSTPWDNEALSIAEELSENSFDGDFRIYAFKTSPTLQIYLRIEKLSSKYGSPSMSDIEAFSRAYRERLDQAVVEDRLPPNISFEVSSPGVERVVRIPEDLERFKDRPMYVKYISDEGPALVPSKENDGIFSLISYDLELGQCIWGIADVKANREQAGKGRPLNKKQREWRLTTPFESLRLVCLEEARTRDEQLVRELALFARTKQPTNSRSS
ncbi:Ribosome maturation factor RimP [Rhynchospora pubera]|uniref:Ribosome maturation factor RimP n=1 Tax=Rhynchospora pubera TaxID=906938 RepID=A0AAV8CQW4_9POAL|nr:Ribosome maturation factor RimP [Rhynchospora pubera]